MSGISRFDLLRGDLSRRRAPLRPPWAMAEREFIAVCTRCDGCIGACPHGILVRGRGGFPRVDFRRGGCDFCARCLDACKAGALRHGGARPWALRAALAEHCLTRSGVECRICAEQCDGRAIRFELRAGAPARPVLDAARCSGCGACVAPCPAGAIEMCRPAAGPALGHARSA